MGQWILVDKLWVMSNFTMEGIVLMYVKCVVLATGEFWCLHHGWRLNLQSSAGGSYRIIFFSGIAQLVVTAHIFYSSTSNLVRFLSLFPMKCKIRPALVQELSVPSPTQNHGQTSFGCSYTNASYSYHHLSFFFCLFAQFSLSFVVDVFVGEQES